MTPRELCVLVEELPDDSRFKRARVRAWTLQEQLIAAAVNTGHGMRQDYRNSHGAPYEWTPAEMPELEHVRAAREAQQQQKQTHRQLAGRVFDAMLSGRLRMSEIDPTTDIEEVLATL